MAPAKKPATYADIEALPEHLVGEIIDGELFVSPRPRPKHALAEGRVHADLDGAFGRGRGGPGGWWILAEPEVRLGAQIVVPDVAGWRRERLPDLPDEVGIRVVPDWICEIVSPSTARIDRGRKLRVYASAGVPHLWIVDPVLRSLEVYRLRDGALFHVDTFLDDAKVRIEPFEAIELELAGWWPPLAPGAREPELEWYSPSGP